MELLLFFIYPLEIYKKKVNLIVLLIASISMSNAEKIEVAEKRIVELKTLIKHWKSSNISSRKSTADLVEVMLSERYEKKAA